jgi:hypothetical protein
MYEDVLTMLPQKQNAPAKPKLHGAKLLQFPKATIKIQRLQTARLKIQTAGEKNTDRR